MAERNTSQKKKSIVLPAALGLVLFILVGLFFLPQLLSTNWAANKVMQTVSDKSPGTVNISDISMGWFNPVSIKGLTYDDPKAGILFKVADLTTAKGLWALATNYKDLGLISIKAPELFITIKEKTAAASPTKSPGQLPTQAPAPKANAPETPSPAEPDSLIFPAINGQLNITGGRVVARLPEGLEQDVLNKLELELKVAILENQLEYMVEFHSGDGKGIIHSTGTLALAPESPANLDKAVSQAAIDITGWEVENLLSILANSSNLPVGKGLVHGQMSLSGSIETGLTVKSNLRAEQIKLHGGPLKTDTPSLDKVDVVLDALKTGSALTVKKLDINSPIATGTASGSFGAGGESKMVSKMEINLAPLFSQFPATLKLKEGLTISKGRLNLDATVGGIDNATSFDTSVRLEGLQGSTGQKKISLEKPITLQARGEQNPTGLRLDHFRILSSFADGQGQGDMNKMQLTLAADLGAALQEIEKFIQVGGWKTTGKMNLNLQVNAKNANLRAISADVTMNDFELQQKGRVIAPRGEFKAKLISDLFLDEQLRPKEMTETSLNIDSWLGKTSINAKKLKPPTDRTSLLIDQLEAKGSLKLDRLSVLLHSLEKLQNDTDFRGLMDFDSRISLNGDKIELSGVEIDINDLLFQQETKKLNEKSIRITTQGKADLEARAAAFKPLEIKTSAAHLIFPELVITDWNRLADGVQTAGTVKLDLDLLTKMLGDFIQLPQKTSVAGNADINIDVALTAANKQSLKLRATASDLKIKSENKPAITEESLHLTIDLKGDADAQNFAVEKLEITTAPISLSASAQIAPKGKERELSSDGMLTMDLPEVSSYLKAFAGLDIEMTGKGSNPFHVNTTSSNGKWINLPRTTTFSTSFRADSIRGFGMLIESLELPIQLADSMGKIEIVGSVNKGSMSLKPSIDFASEPPVVSIPENSTLLTEVALTEGMSKDLLVHIHPIFKGAAVTQGTVDLTMQNFSWPLNEKTGKDAAFSGHLIFKGVKLQAGGLLAPLLAVMKVDDREIILSEQPMKFTGENDRVNCSPLEVSINEYSLKLSGSIGFDQSLDYLAQIPVTKKMVSSEVYEYLEDTYISVPIGGTVSNPTISKNLVQTALKDLAIQAGAKQISDQAGKLLQKLFQ